MHGVGVDEGHLEAEHAAPRGGVDQLRPCVRESRERGVDVAHLVGHVVHSGSTPGEEPSDRRVLAERAEQLEPAVADADAGCLDALVVDPLPLLEPGAEEALVGRERSVEVVHGDSQVVDRAGRLHDAIVCERLEPAMRTRVPLLLLATALLAGCGGSRRSAKSNGEASKPAAQVLADTEAAAGAASSTHISGRIVSNGTTVTLDLSLVRGKGASGSLSAGGLSFDLVRIGATAYIRGSDAFYRHFTGPAVARLLHGKWLKAPVTYGGLRSLVPLTSIASLFARVGAHHGALTAEGPLTYHGQRVVEIRDRSDGSTLYVAATGKPYPVAIVGGRKGPAGTVVFDRWNQPVSLSAPPQAIDLGALHLSG